MLCSRELTARCQAHTNISTCVHSQSQCQKHTVLLIDLLLHSCRCTAAGTTTATVLTRAIFGEGCKSVAAGMNPMDLRRGIQLAVDSVVQNLKSRATMISTTSEIAQVYHPALPHLVQLTCASGI